MSLILATSEQWVSRYSLERNSSRKVDMKRDK